MCSVSWQQQQNEILICFNRDEQKTRAVAEPPKVILESSAQVIMPIDPDGGGTWISVNQFGLFLGLLNFYEADVVKNSTQDLSHKYISRGLLVRQLSTSENLSDLEVSFSQQDLQRYRPFKLMVISTQEKKLFVWNGAELSSETPAEFICSSSFQSESVLQYRYQQFDQAENDLLKLHSDHSVRKDAHSICMHRDDAQTVSLSVVKINSAEVSFQYWNGAPCSSQPSGIISLDIDKYKNTNNHNNSEKRISQNV